MQLLGKNVLPSLEEEILSNPHLSSLTFYLYSDKDNLPCFYYLKGIKRVLEKYHIPYVESFYDKALSVEQNLNNFKTESKNRFVVLARPLGIKEESLFVESIDPNFDPDRMTTFNQGRLFKGDLDYLPATCQSVRRILDFYQIDLENKKCLILGRSITVGLPLLELVNKKNGLPVLAHSKISPSLLALEALESDVVFLATGHSGLIPRTSFTEEHTIIDCGFSKNGGDLGFVPEEGEVKAYTPVPNGVGTLTSYCLILNALASLK